jgi:xylan 1,4-beta-xylosidase
VDDFVRHCAHAGVPADFVSTHYYPTDAFGKVDTDTVTQLEHAPRDVMRGKALEARAAAGDRPLYYTEWNISSNPRDPQHDSSFAAALATRIVMSVDDAVDGYSWWTFSDIFEENYFPSVPFHGGFGLMNLYGIPKPIYRAFQLVRALGDQRFAVEGAHPTVDVWSTRREADGDRRSSLLVVNQAMPRHPIADESLDLVLTHDPRRRLRAASIERVDEQHANPAKAWTGMGSPEYLKPAAVAALMQSSQLMREPLGFASASGTTQLDFIASPQSVNLIRLEWETR